MRKVPFGQFGRKGIQFEICFRVLMSDDWAQFVAVQSTDKDTVNAKDHFVVHVSDYDYSIFIKRESHWSTSGTRRIRSLTMPDSWNSQVWS